MTFLVHRWLGVVLALLMTVWAVSGITMMYVAYPETTEDERLAGLEPLDLSACCSSARLRSGPIDGASIEMLLGRPVVRLSGADGALVALDGGPAPQIGPVQAGQIAATHMRRASNWQGAIEVAPTRQDQWTVSGSFRRHAPLYKTTAADSRGTELYISGTTGEVVQDTTRRERLWNWLGAIPHWLYFSALRGHQPLWNTVVVYASLLGVFLTATGLYVGVLMYGRGQRKSPFRGIALWHHWTGLLFGVVTLTWVASGLFSMNPWGWFESDGPGEAIPNLTGRSLTGSDAAALAAALAAAPRPGTVVAEASVQGGRAYAILVDAAGTRTRAALPGLAPAPVSADELDRKATAAYPGAAFRAATITEPDAYHYGHKSEPVLPVYRVIYSNPDETRLYFDPGTGELVNFFDAERRAFRWWHLGLHRLDFPVLRARPLWDLVTVPLLIGVSLLCGLGLWMGIRRLQRPGGPIRRGAVKHTA